MRGLVTEAHERFAANADGAVSTVYPALAEVPPDLFGLCVAGVDGPSTPPATPSTTFTIMSVSKPFVFALVCQALGPEAVRERSASTPPACRSTR